jgi:hypothetical protein
LTVCARHSGRLSACRPSEFAGPVKEKHAVAKDVAFDASLYDTWRMTGLLLLLSLLALYVIVRLAVRHGIEDAWKRRADLSPAEAADNRPVVGLLGNLSTTWYTLLGAFGWFG